MQVSMIGPMLLKITIAAQSKAFKYDIMNIVAKLFESCETPDFTCQNVYLFSHFFTTYSYEHEPPLLRDYVKESFILWSSIPCLSVYSSLMVKAIFLG